MEALLAENMLKQRRHYRMLARAARWTNAYCEAPLGPRRVGLRLDRAAASGQARGRIRLEAAL